MFEAPKEQVVIWSPLPGSQSLALSCPANHIFYEGSRGPGKTDAQLMFFRKFVGMGYGAHWRGVIFDREYKMLDDLINKSLRWFSKFRDGARFLRSKGDYRWIWPTGEELSFRQIKREEDYWNYHGQEFTYIGWNELCKYPNANLYQAMMSCNRSSFLPNEHSPNLDDPLPEIPLVVFSTANPYGPGHSWVKKEFVDPAPPGKLQWKSCEVFNPQTQQREVIRKSRVRLFGSYMENRFLSPQYVMELESIRDPNKRKAWLGGSWDIVAGGAFDDLWSESVHVVSRFIVPAGWRLDRSFDWGSTKPFSVGWWAEADGTEARLRDGSIFCPPKGTLVRFSEWYGDDPTQAANTGLKMSPKKVAQGIQAHEQQLLNAGWIQAPVFPGPADNSIFDEERNEQEELDSIARIMERAAGILWERSNKSPGSRKRGLEVARDRFENSLLREGPGIYFMDNCRAAISQLPNLPRDPDDQDDVDTTSEDHVWDDIRYRSLKGDFTATTQLPILLPR